MQGLLAETIVSFDPCVFVTPGYNHGPAGALKNAIDYLYREWNNKAAGFVGYGGAGGTRAVEQWRLIMAEVQVASDVPTFVSLATEIITGCAAIEAALTTQWPNAVACANTRRSAEVADNN